jgi:dihydrofolate reductase
MEPTAGSQGGKPMSRIVISEFVSLDGVIGRVTYQGFAEAWPKMTDESGFADAMNSMTKYVISSTLTDADASWHDTTVLSGDVVSEKNGELS